MNRYPIGMKLQGTLLIGFSLILTAGLGCNEPPPVPEIPASKTLSKVPKTATALAVPKEQNKPKARVPAQKFAADVFRTEGDITRVKRSLIESLAKKPEFVLKQARIVPSITPEGIDGMRLLNIEKDSFFSRAGFQNGDVIKRALGQELVRPDQLLGLPGRVKEMGKLGVIFTRDGKTKTLSFRAEK